MNPDSSLFSHQFYLTQMLAEHFDNVIVFTSEEEYVTGKENISVAPIGWAPESGLFGVIKFLKLVIPYLISKRKDVIVFSHMTDVHAFLIAPLCRFLGINHYLWYAHKKLSPYLFLSFPFLTGVITSTVNSCPLKGKKIKVVGQGVKLQGEESVNSRLNLPPVRWYTIGRIDPSKNIFSLVESLKLLREKQPELTFDIFGSPSSHKSNWYYNELKLKVKSEQLNWIHFHGSLKNSEISKVASEYDGFIHAFDGSLDKVLVEAILCKRIVVSANNEFLREFGYPTGHPSEPRNSIDLQLRAIYSASEAEIYSVIRKRFENAQKNHSAEQLISKLIEILE